MGKMPCFEKRYIRNEADFSTQKKSTKLYFTLPTVNHENKTKCTKKIAVGNYAKKTFFCTLKTLLLRGGGVIFHRFKKLYTTVA